MGNKITLKSVAGRSAAARMYSSMFYRFMGHDATKSPLLMLMGYSGSSTSWTSVFLNELASKWPLLVVDTVGTGQSKKDISADRLTLQSVTGDLLALLTELGIQNVHILGYSYGGTIALNALSVLGCRVSSSILVSTTLGGSSYVSPDAEVLKGLAKPSGLTVEEKTASIWRLCLGEKNYPKYEKTMQEVVQNQQGHLTPSWVLREQLQNYAAFNFIEQSKDINIPTLIITGDRDPITPAENSYNLSSKLPNGRLLVLEDCAHMPHIEKPMEFIFAIVNHLALHDVRQNCEETSCSTQNT
jgi:pimeloyl-ACP methyl ester carboxylesterase